MHIMNRLAFICTHKPDQLIFNLSSIHNFTQLDILFTITNLIILGQNNKLIHTILIIFLLILNLSSFQHIK